MTVVGPEDGEEAIDVVGSGADAVSHRITIRSLGTVPGAMSAVRIQRQMVGHRAQGAKPV